MQQPYYSLADVAKDLNCSEDTIRQRITTGRIKLYLHTVNLPVMVRNEDHYIGRCKISGITRISFNDAMQVINPVNKSFLPYLYLTDKTTVHDWTTEKVHFHERLYKKEWKPINFSEFKSIPNSDLENISFFSEPTEYYSGTGGLFDTKDMYRFDYTPGIPDISGFENIRTVDEFLNDESLESNWGLLGYKPPQFKIDDLYISSDDLDEFSSIKPEQQYIEMKDAMTVSEVAKSQDATKPTAVSMESEMQHDKEVLAKKWREEDRSYNQLDLSKELATYEKYNHIKYTTIEKLTCSTTKFTHET